jgi:type IV pilus assembly protein PilO
MKDIDINDLDLSAIGSWPIPVKIAVIAIVSIIVLVAGYFLDISGQLDVRERSQRQEVTLKSDFETKQAKAANLEAYKQQLADMETSFGTMLRQLPSKTEVEALIVEISQTGLSSGVNFQLFKPNPEQQIEFYAELPIQMKMTGTYHQFGEFVSGIAALPRIVTLHNISIKKDKKSDKLSMEVLAKTYRYMDDNEIAQAQSSQQKKKKRGR